MGDGCGHNVSHFSLPCVRFAVFGWALFLGCIGFNRLDGIHTWGVCSAGTWRSCYGHECRPGPSLDLSEKSQGERGGALTRAVALATHPAFPSLLGCPSQPTWSVWSRSTWRGWLRRHYQIHFVLGALWPGIKGRGGGASSSPVVVAFGLPIVDMDRVKFVHKSVGTPTPCDHVEFPTIIFLPTIFPSHHIVPLVLVPCPSCLTTSRLATAAQYQAAEAPSHGSSPPIQEVSDFFVGPLSCTHCLTSQRPPRLVASIL